MNFIDQQTIEQVEARRKKLRIIDLLVLSRFPLSLQSQNSTEALQFVNRKIVDEIFWIGGEVKKFNAQLPSGIFNLSAAADLPVYISIIGDQLSLGIGGVRLFDPKYKKNLSLDATQLENSLSLIKNIIDFTTNFSQ